MNSLDIPDTYYEKAEARYHAIGRWVNRGDSIIAKYKPEIYLQGSFSLGTVVKPINAENMI